MVQGFANFVQTELWNERAPNSEAAFVGHIIPNYIVSNQS